MVLRIAICDDEIRFAELLQKKILELRPSSQVTMYESGEELLNSKLEYDILILDIEMPNKNGMDVAKELRLCGFDGQIVFLTNYPDYIQEAFKVHAFRYLYKPMDKSQLEETLSSVEKDLQETSRVITIKGDKMITVKISHIIYLEAVRNKTFIMTSDGELECRKPLREVFEMLGDSEFIQIHKSYVIAMRYIKSIGENKIVLQVITPQLPLSRRKRTQVRDSYIEYVRKHAIYL